MGYYCIRLGYYGRWLKEEINYAKKEDPEIALLNRVTDLLMDESTKPRERQILLEAKRRLEKRVILSNIIWHLKAELTPWAMTSKLSKGVGKLYCDIIAGNIGSSGTFRTGIGIGAVYGGFFK